MSMSRKHYEAMAQIIRAERNVGHDDGMSPDMIAGIDLATRNIAGQLATVFQIDNPNFDRNRFFDACNIE